MPRQLHEQTKFSLPSTTLVARAQSSNVGRSSLRHTLPPLSSSQSFILRTLLAICWASFSESPGATAANTSTPRPIDEMTSLSTVTEADSTLWIIAAKSRWSVRGPKIGSARPRTFHFGKQRTMKPRKEAAERKPRQWSWNCEECDVRAKDPLPLAMGREIDRNSKLERMHMRLEYSVAATGTSAFIHQMDEWPLHR